MNIEHVASYQRLIHATFIFVKLSLSHHEVKSMSQRKGGEVDQEVNLGGGWCLFLDEIMSSISRSL